MGKEGSDDEQVVGNNAPIYRAHRSAQLTPSSRVRRPVRTPDGAHNDSALNDGLRPRGPATRIGRRSG